MICPCGGKLYRHGTKHCKIMGWEQRYRCRSCGKSVTIRNGEVSTLRGRPTNEQRRAA